MADDENSLLFAQRRVCLLCEETFTVGEMYPGKRHTDPLECPYCRCNETSPADVLHKCGTPHE